MGKQCVLYALFIFLVFFAAPASAQTTLNKVRIGIPSFNIAQLPLMIARSHGFFKSEGLDVELIVISPPVAIQALIAGELDLATPFFSAVRASIAGISVPTVMIIQTATDHTIIAKSDIRTMEELRGKTLAVSALKSLADVLARIALRKYGLSPEIDVKMFPVGGGSGLMLGALQGGRVDAAILASPHSKIALMSGFRELVSTRTVSPLPAVGLSTTKKVMQQKPAALVGIIRATLKGIEFIKQNKDEAVSIMRKELGIKDARLLNLVYDDAVTLYSDTGVVSDDFLKTTIAVANEIQGTTKTVAASDVVDWRFAREALRTIRK